MEWKAENEKNLGEILAAVEEDCVKHNATIIRIRIDNETVPTSRFDEIFKYSLDSVQVLEIETVAENDIIFALNAVAKTFDETMPKLSEIPVLLQSNKDVQASQILTAFVDTFGELCHIVRLCSLFPARFENFVVDKKLIADFLNDFTDILQEFEKSLISHDTVLTGDLSEYEIVPRLQAFCEAITTLYPVEN